MLLLFGEFQDGEAYATNEGTALFILAACILTLILLNLVIAIMSDTYERVMTNIVDSDNKQLNSMILQYENFLAWKRKAGSPVHLFWFTYLQASSSAWVSQVDYVTEALKGPVGEVKKQILGLKKEMVLGETRQRMSERHIANKFDEARRRQEGIREELLDKIVDLEKANKGSFEKVNETLNVILQKISTGSSAATGEKKESPSADDNSEE